MQEDIGVWVINQDSSLRDELNKELEDGKLRQGWGSSQSKLDCDEDRWVKRIKDSDDWLWKYCEKNEDKLRKQYRLLQPLKEISEGDIILIPNCPDNFSLTIAEADKNPYKFEELKGLDDYRHIIKIKKDKIGEYYKSELFGDENAANSFYSSYQRRMQGVYKHKRRIIELYNKSSTYQKKTIWAINLKTAHKKEYDPVKYCFDESVVGIGWSYLYKDKTVKSNDEALKVYDKNKNDGDLKPLVKTFIEELKEEDFVIFYYEGKYHIGKISNSEGKYSYNEYDLGHIKKVESWKSIEPKFLSGYFKRRIPPRQTFSSTGNDVKDYYYIDKLYNWKNKKKKVERKIKEYIQNVWEGVFRVIDPVELEDVIINYLQTEKGWSVVKSTCKSSNPVFECELFKIQGNNKIIGHIQVKSGEAKISETDIFIQKAKEGDIVFVFLDLSEPAEKLVDEPNIIFIKKEDILNYMDNNIAELPESLKIRLSIL